MNYYNKSDLSQLSILHFSEYIEKSKSVDLRQIVEDDLNFVFSDADVFRQGVCQLFAYALHQKFKYKAYKIQVESSCHIFCKTSDNQYVDVRGITNSFSEFISGLDLPNVEYDTSEAYSFSENDFNGDYHDVALAFAKALVEHDIQRYKTG